jgi:chromosome segregation ATPase
MENDDLTPEESGEPTVGKKKKRRSKNPLWQMGPILLASLIIAGGVYAYDSLTRPSKIPAMEVAPTQIPHAQQSVPSLDMNTTSSFEASTKEEATTTSVTRIDQTMNPNLKSIFEAQKMQTEVLSRLVERLASEEAASPQSADSKEQREQIEHLKMELENLRQQAKQQSLRIANLKKENKRLSGANLYLRQLERDHRHEKERLQRQVEALRKQAASSRTKKEKSSGMPNDWKVLGMSADEVIFGDSQGNVHVLRPGQNFVGQINMARNVIVTKSGVAIPGPTR